MAQAGLGIIAMCLSGLLLLLLLQLAAAVDLRPGSSATTMFFACSTGSVCRHPGTPYVGAVASGLWWQLAEADWFLLQPFALPGTVGTGNCD